MKSTYFFSLAGLATLTSCSSPKIPAGLFSAVGNPQLTLDARFPLSSWPCGKKPYVTFKPGQTLVSSDTENAPTFNPNSAPFTTPTNGTGKYVFLMVDPNTNTTDPTSPALHTLYANVSITSNGELNWTVLAPFINPEPDTVAPHNYTLLLFAQPSEQFIVPEQFESYLPLNLSDVYARENFPIVDFIKDTGLGVPVAGDWFREGLTSSNSTSSSSAVASLCSVTTLTTPVATPTGVFWNTSTPATPTGTAIGKATGTGTITIPYKTSTTGSSTGTSTATSTSPALAGAAAGGSGASIGNVLFALGAALSVFGML